MSLGRKSFLTSLGGAAIVPLTLGSTNRIARPQLTGAPKKITTPAPIITRQTQWPPRYDDASLMQLRLEDHPPALNEYVPGRGLVRNPAADPYCVAPPAPIPIKGQLTPTYVCGGPGSGANASASFANGVGYAYTASNLQQFYINGVLDHTIRWNQPVGRTNWTVTLSSAQYNAVVTGINTAILQANQQYDWIAGCAIIIYTNAFYVTQPSFGGFYGVNGFVSNGDGTITIYDGFSNPNALGRIYLPPYSRIAHCISEALVTGAAIVGISAVAAAVIALGCANPASAFTCAFVGGIVSFMTGVVINNLWNSFVNDCG